ncbi:hypothetical protein [Streptomyces sp. NPDC058872]|uniref:hypothetical protein n=1 Tax=Streptomyces sp. NPDC058872 TaxID=3346661 RepID=UPI0036AAC56D
MRSTRCAVDPDVDAPAPRSVECGGFVVPAIRAARVVVALRGAGYGVPAVRDVMASLSHLDGSGEVQHVLRQCLDRIAGRTVALLRAGADLATVITSVGESPAAPRPDEEPLVIVP